jgi:GNAT superfamily N-acetyltransferase
MILRQLDLEEIDRMWTIDRTEVIERVYRVEEGKLVLRPDYFHAHGWPPGSISETMPRLLDCHAYGGEFWAMFDGEKLVAAAVLEARFIGAERDTLQLKWLHVSNGYRDQGVGRRLFLHAAERARLRGARRMYISATPSEHTVDFYRNLGCVLSPEPDPALFALEPEDIHLEYPL